MPKVITYIGLGSNLDQPAQQLVNAVEALKKLPQSKLISCSSFYRSTALTTDNDTSMPDYLNAVACLETGLDPLGLLDELQAIEFAQGRVPTEQRWQARPLDLDILIYGDEQFSDARLTIPHAEITKRDFVLVPLVEIAPDLEITGNGKISMYLDGCQQTLLEKIS